MQNSLSHLVRCHVNKPFLLPSEFNSLLSPVLFVLFGCLFRGDIGGHARNSTELAVLIELWTIHNVDPGVARLSGMLSPTKLDRCHFALQDVLPGCDA